MKLSVDIKGLDDATKALVDRFSARRMNTAAATGLTRTARQIERDWQRQLTSTLDRPTRATTNAIVVKTATKDKLSAEVFIKDQAGARGTAPAQWLAPNEYAGSRRLKKFEQALIAQGSMPAGKRAVPGPGAKLDSFGNVSRGTIVQVIAQLGAQYSPGYQQVISRSAAKRAQTALLSGREYVAIVKPVGKLRAGIYRRKGGKGRELVAVFFFVGSTTYHAVTNLGKTAQETAGRVLASEVLRAIRDTATRLAERG